MVSLWRALVLGLLLLPGPVGAESRRYDASGRYMGRSERGAGTTRFYDAAGRYRGRAEAQGSAVRRYDALGRYTGRTEPAERRR